MSIPIYRIGEVRKGSLTLSGRPPPSGLKKPDYRKVKSFGGATFKSAGSSPIPVSQIETGQVGSILTLGVKEDFNFLLKLERRFLNGVSSGQIGGPENDQMASAMRKALAVQPAWRDAPSIIKELQPLLLTLFLDKPRWYSREDLDICETLGFLVRRESGDMRFESMMKFPHFFPLLKVSLEPCDDMMANFEMGVAWIRAQQLDPQRKPSMMDLLLTEVVYASVVEDFGTMHTLAERVKLVQTNRSGLHVDKTDAERDGVPGIIVHIVFANHHELDIKGVFLPSLVMDEFMKKNPDTFSPEKLRENGFGEEADAMEAKGKQREAQKKKQGKGRMKPEADQAKAAGASGVSSPTPMPTPTPAKELAAREAAEMVAHARGDPALPAEPVLVTMMEEMGVRPASQGRGPQITPLSRGVRVRIFGLSGRADLNGKLGVLGTCRDNGRWACTIDGTRETVALRPENLFPWQDEQVEYKVKAFTPDDRVEVMAADGTWESGTISSRRRVDGPGPKEERPMVYGVELDMVAGEIELNSTDDRKRLRAGPTHLECAFRSFGGRAVATGQITSGAFEAATQLVASKATSKSEQRALMIRMTESWLPAAGTPVRLAMETYRGRRAIFGRSMEGQGSDGVDVFAVALPGSEEGGILVPVEVIRACPAAEGHTEREAGGANGRRAAPIASNAPSRFRVGDRVEVKVSPNSEPGRHIDMISVHNCEGGRWLAAKVQALRFRQDDWCPGFFCAYAVKVQGDVGPDGTAFASPVREDDDRCIRAAPPLPGRAPPPPRFAVGTRVQCNGGPHGFQWGVVREHWVEGPDGCVAPYVVELEEDEGPIDAAFEALLDTLADAQADALTDQVAASAGVAERLETMRRLLREHGRLAADAARAHVIIPYDEDEAVRL